MVSLDPKADGDALIRVRGVAKSYWRDGCEVPILQGLDLDVAKGEFVALGPSGSGKTTLLNLIGGLDVPTAGTISVADDEITRLSRRRLTEWRARPADAPGAPAARGDGAARRRARGPRVPLRSRVGS
jgi:putative ABC transport system ATP-binding protein